MSESKTPKTDAAELPLSYLYEDSDDSPSGYVHADFARTLEVELTHLQADAQRYRWLRSQTAALEGKAMVHVQPAGRIWGAFMTPRPNELDAAIDAAMKGTPDA